MSPTIPVVLIKADTQITAVVATDVNGGKYGRIIIGPPDHTHPFGGDAAIIANDVDTLVSMAEVIGQLAEDLRTATS